MKNNILGWFEIPVKDMDRAISFYEAVFDIRMERHTMNTLDMAWFPWKDGMPGAPGSHVCNEEFYRPSHDGTLVYLTTPSGNLNEDEEKVVGNGGKVLIPRRQIFEDVGFMSVIEDSEGNRIAIHSRT